MYCVHILLNYFVYNIYYAIHNRFSSIEDCNCANAVTTTNVVSENNSKRGPQFSPDRLEHVCIYNIHFKMKNEINCQDI